MFLSVSSLIEVTTSMFNAALEALQGERDSTWGLTDFQPGVSKWYETSF